MRNCSRFFARVRIRCFRASRPPLSHHYDNQCCASARTVYISKLTELHRSLQLPLNTQTDLLLLIALKFSNDLSSSSSRRLLSGTALSPLASTLHLSKAVESLSSLPDTTIPAIPFICPSQTWVSSKPESYSAASTSSSRPPRTLSADTRRFAWSKNANNRCPIRR